MTFAWTQERIDRLKDLWRAGASGSVIAGKLGTTRGAVIGKAHRLGLTGRPSPIKLLAAGEMPKRRKPAAKAARAAPADPLPSPPKAPIRLDPVRTCQWTDSSGAPWVFCGARCEHGFSWCPEHRARVFQPKVAAE